MINATHVTKSFRSRGADAIVALDHVDLKARGGEFVGVVGPSGSGKSTLLFSLGGLLAPDEGRVEAGGRDLYAFGARERARIRRQTIGFVFQTFNLIPYLDCEQNVMLPALLDGASRAKARGRALALLEEFGLAERRKHRPDELSVGERQRVAIARALINKPEVLLADEPTGNLDPLLGLQVFERLEQCSREGVTVVMVTHDPTLASRCSQIVSLDHGRVSRGEPDR